jgi:hypothetical protein
MAGNKGLVFSILTLLTPILVFAQPTLTDSLNLIAATDHAKNIYLQSTKDHSNLYNGKEYIAFKKKMPEVGTLFFHSDDWMEGTVFYDGELYDNAPMRLDLLHEKLLVENKSHGQIELISEKVKYFALDGHTFLGSNNNEEIKLLSAGFYDLIYSGTTKVLVRRLKVAEERIETQVSMILTFKEKNTITVLKNGKNYLAGNKSSALKIFEDQKSALKKFMSKNNIRYRTNREEALIKMAAEYDQLTH